MCRIEAYVDKVRREILYSKSNLKFSNSFPLIAACYPVLPMSLLSMIVSCPLSI